MAEASARARRPSPDAVLLSCSSWAEFSAALANADAATKGATFELLTRAYLALEPKYRAQIKHVWSTRGEVPNHVRAALNLPSSDTRGIDFVAETHDGGLWAVQCKYIHDGTSLPRNTATGLIAGLNGRPFAYGLICATVDSTSRNLEGEKRIGYALNDEWHKLGPEWFEGLHAWLRDRKLPTPMRVDPRPHQARALADLRRAASAKRSQVIMACGSGKSLIGFWTAEKYRTVLVTVPNLSLVRQLLKTYAEQSIANGLDLRYCVVCSDSEAAAGTAAADLGVLIHTNPAEVARWLEANRHHCRVVFTTYQSGPALAEAAKRAGVTFDLGILDEAHRTAGRAGGKFGHLLHDGNAKIRRRIFMTATPRIYDGAKERPDVVCMSDERIYGPRVHEFSFKAAVDAGTIAELKILDVPINDAEVQRLLEHREFIRLKKEHADEVIRVEDLVSALALRKAMRQYPIRRTLGFYNSVARCRLAAEIQTMITKCWRNDFATLDVFHVDAGMTTAQRDGVLDEFASSPNALLTNVRVFVEGVDCPELDAVLFADPRQSTIDIVQGIGRALRTAEGKTAGYALVPTQIAPDGTASDAAFDQLVKIACALSSVDQTIAEYFAAIAQRKPWSGRRVFETSVDVEIGQRFDLDRLNRAIAVRVWERTVEWRPFENARSFVQALGLTSVAEWIAYCKLGEKPADIPTNPDKIYPDKWRGMGDWLGTGNVAPQEKNKTWPSKREFMEQCKELQIRNNIDYHKRRATGELPPDFPADPHDSTVYGSSLWGEYRDFYTWPITKFEAEMRRLGLQSAQEVLTYLRKNKPFGCPGVPDHYYRGKGCWQSWGVHLGTNRPGQNNLTFPSEAECMKILQGNGVTSAAKYRILRKELEALKVCPASMEQKFPGFWGRYKSFRQP